MKSFFFFKQYQLKKKKKKKKKKLNNGSAVKLNKLYKNWSLISFFKYLNFIVLSNHLSHTFSIASLNFHKKKKKKNKKIKEKKKKKIKWIKIKNRLSIKIK